MKDWAVWRRVDPGRGGPLDLLAARFGRRHYAPHIHEEYAIGVCTYGAEVMRYRGELHRSGTGSIVLVEPGEVHTGGPAGPQGYAYRCIYPSAALLTGDAVPDAAGRPRFRGPIIADRALAEELRRTHLLLSADHDPLEAESRLSWVLATLVRRHATASSAGPPAAVPRRPDAGRIARAVMDRLADQITDPPSLAEIGRDLGLSRYQVLRAFRGAVGMPPYAWLAQHRVGRSRALLAAGHRPAEVAALVGFADQAHLTGWFRRVLGVTPGMFRNGVQDSAPRPT